MSNLVTKITEQNFESFIKENKKVLIDFWASWCGPCRMTAPELEAFAEAHKDIAVGKINVDEEPELTRLFKVDSIPTVAIVKDNTFLDMSVGYVSKNALSDLISQYR